MKSAPFIDASNCFHILTSTRFDFDLFEARASINKGPRHTVWQLKQALDAQIHQPAFDDDQPVNPVFKVLSKLVTGRPQQWALAWDVLDRMGDGDVVYCCGEDGGIPLAILAVLRHKKTHLVLNVMSPKKFRSRFYLQGLKLGRRFFGFTVNTATKKEYLEQKLGAVKGGIISLPKQTDEQFFCPGSGTIETAFPLIATAGLEQRDYATLATAVMDLPVEVKACAVSPNATANTKCKIPASLPENMEMRYFDWAELRDLYRSSELVVISLLDNTSAAGLTTLMEALACRKPVIITATEGLAEELVAQQLVWGVKPGDADELRATITHVLANPEMAQQRAEMAYRYFLENHTSAYFVGYLSNLLRQVTHNVPGKTPQIECQG